MNLYDIAESKTSAAKSATTDAPATTDSMASAAESATRSKNATEASAAESATRAATTNSQPATWFEDGVEKTSPAVNTDKFGSHLYPYDGGTSDCVYGCGCWMGPCRSGGPVDPFGMCPKNPRASAASPQLSCLSVTSAADDSDIVAENRASAATSDTTTRATETSAAESATDCEADRDQGIDANATDGAASPIDTSAAESATQAIELNTSAADAARPVVFQVATLSSTSADGSATKELLARHDDPGTSKEAAAAVEDSVKVVAMRRHLLETFFDAHRKGENGLTSEEAATKCGYTAENGAWKRVSDLQRVQHIRDSGIRRNGTSGRRQRVMTITQDGIAFLGGHKYVE